MHIRVTNFVGQSEQVLQWHLTRYSIRTKLRCLCQFGNQVVCSTKVTAVRDIPWCAYIKDLVFYATFMFCRGIYVCAIDTFAY